MQVRNTVQHTSLPRKTREAHSLPQPTSAWDAPKQIRYTELHNMGIALSRENRGFLRTLGCGVRHCAAIRYVFAT